MNSEQLAWQSYRWHQTWRPHRMERVFMSVLTTPGWMAANVKPSSGVTSDAQASVTEAAHICHKRRSSSV